MILSRTTFTLGDIIQWSVKYDLKDGDSITSATVTADKTDVVIGTVAVYEGRRVTFYLSGGSINELFTITVTIITTNAEKFLDTIQFTVVAP